MGAVNSKPAPCSFEQLLKAKNERAKSMRYSPGEASNFYYLCKEGKTDQVRQILNDEACPSIEELNQLQPNGSTPLHAATFYNHLEIVKLLLEHNCPRNTLNRYGNTAYDEAKSFEMKNLFLRPESTDRFHETNTTETISVFLSEANVESVNASKTAKYIHLFQTPSEVFEYSLNQQTTAMWLKFYNWFSHTFRTAIEREDLHVDTFDLINHPDFKQFLERSLADPKKYAQTMKSINKAKQLNSIEPLIALYTSEDVGFYRPFNKLLVQSSSNTEISEHLCDRFIIEFYIRHQELKQRAFTGTVYRGATVDIDTLAIYLYAMESDPPGIIGFKAFTSTSTDASVALNFAFCNPLSEDQKHLLFIFEIVEESPTIFGISDISEHRHEQEVLILPGNLFNVTKIEEQLHPPITKIYLSHWKVSISFWEKIKQTFRAGTKSLL
jgi:hypothetical protein